MDIHEIKTVSKGGKLIAFSTHKMIENQTTFVIILLIRIYKKLN